MLCAICDSQLPDTTWLDPALRGLDVDCVHCSDADGLLDSVVRRRPDVVVYAFHGDGLGDLAALHLLKRVAPEIRLVLMAPDDSPWLVRQARELKPSYVAVGLPAGGHELLEAVRASGSIGAED